MFTTKFNILYKSINAHKTLKKKKIMQSMKSVKHLIDGLVCSYPLIQIWVLLITELWAGNW